MGEPQAALADRGDRRVTVARSRKPRAGRRRSRAGRARARRANRKATRGLRILVAFRCHAWRRSRGCARAAGR